MDYDRELQKQADAVREMEEANNRFAIFDRRTNNFLDEFATREEAETALADWPGCEILDFGEFADFSATTEEGE